MWRLLTKGVLILELGPHIVYATTSDVGARRRVKAAYAGMVVVVVVVVGGVGVGLDGGHLCGEDTGTGV